jgi:hypothetical protein
MHRGVCATDGGRLLKFVDVVANNPQRRNDTIFTYTLTKTEAGRMEWVRDAAAPTTAKDRMRFPCEHGQATHHSLLALRVH